MFEQSRGIAVALTHDTLGMVVAEEPVVLERSGVPGANRFHALDGETLEFLKLAMVDLESCDGMKFTHRFCLWAATEAIPPRRSQRRRSLKEHCNWRPPCRWSRDVAGT